MSRKWVCAKTTFLSKEDKICFSQWLQCERDDLEDFKEKPVNRGFHICPFIGESFIAFHLKGPERRCMSTKMLNNRWKNVAQMLKMTVNS